MLSFCPAIVKIEDLSFPEWGATLNVTTPFPTPVSLSKVIQGSLLTAVQGQPATVVTLTAACPPVEVNDRDSELRR